MSSVERLEKGQVHFRTIIEVVGRPKEHVEETIREHVEKIKKDEDLEIVNQDFADVKKEEDKENQEGLWSTFVELELWIKNLPSLIGFCFDYMPSSVEILAPEEMQLKANMLNGFLNDLQAKLHHLDMAVKQLSMENQFLRNNTNKLLKNMITLLLLKDGRKCEELAKITGIKPEDLQVFLDKMVEENELKKTGDKYFLIRKK